MEKKEEIIEKFKEEQLEEEKEEIRLILQEENIQELEDDEKEKINRIGFLDRKATFR